MLPQPPLLILQLRATSRAAVVYSGSALSLCAVFRASDAEQKL
jgi:hypothetical protein